MKVSRKKQVWTWVLGVFLFLAIPMAFVGIAGAKSMAAKVGSNKALILESVVDYYQGKPINKNVQPSSQKTVTEIFRAVEQRKGKFLAAGAPDTIPDIKDLISVGHGLSYNLPVQFEKGYATFTFRIENDGTSPKIVSLASTDGILPQDNFRKRLQQKLP